MQKNMYSLILMDDVVHAVDKRAHELGTSRSNLINRILAQQLSVLTPEVCIAQIFEQVVREVEHEELLLPIAPTGSMLTIRGVLSFKYNPAIHYRLEISEADENKCAGELRVTSRSQSADLLAKLAMFYELWSQIETSCIAEQFSDIQLKYSFSGGRFLRRFSLGGEQADLQQVGEALGRYVRLMYQEVGMYFAAPGGIDMQTFSVMLDAYRNYLANSPMIVY